MKRRLRYGDNQKGVRTAIGLGLALILAACGGDASDDGVEEPTTVVTEAPTTTTTTTTAPPAEPDPPPEPLPSILDESFIAETAAAADVVGGSAFVFAVLDADGNILQGVKGTDDDDNVPSAESQFRVGSITKVFTSLVTLTLVDDGLVDLDAPASTFVTRVPVDDSVTVRHLLQHRTGIFNVTDLETFFPGVVSDQARVWTPEEQMELIADQKLRFEPGSQFRYSNSNYVILGVLIEEVTGQTYDEAVRERIIDPLGMDSTYLALFEEGDEPFDPYLRFRAEYDYTSLASVAWAAGGMVSSAPDLHTMFTALFNDEIISSELRDQMTEGDEYGMGVELWEWSVGLVGHSGGIPGYFTFVRHSPSTGITAFLATTDDEGDPGPAIDALFKGFEGLEQAG